MLLVEMGGYSSLQTMSVDILHLLYLYLIGQFFFTDNKLMIYLPLF